MNAPTGELDRCWRRIGVYGDGSCAELAGYVHCRNCPRFAAAARSLLARASQLAIDAHQDPADPRHETRAAPQGWLVFRLAGTLLALSTAVAAELAADQRPRRIAHRAGRLLDGLVNIRGELHLCIALDRLLGLGRGSGSAAGTPRLVLVRAAPGSASWAFRADAVLGVERFADRSIGAPPPAAPAALAPFVRGIVQLAERPHQRSQERTWVDSGWTGSLLLLDGAALLAGLDNAVY